MVEVGVAVGVVVGDMVAVKVGWAVAVGVIVGITGVGNVATSDWPSLQPTKHKISKLIIYFK